MAEYKKLEIFRRSTKAYELRFKKDGIVVDLTGWTIYFTVKDKISASDENANIKKTITSHLSATDGKTLIELSPSDTDLLGNYYYSFSYKTGDGDEGVLFWGRIKVKDTILDNRV